AATGWKLNLQSAHRPGGQKAPNSKVKFTCVTCGLNVWGKPDAVVLCAACLFESLGLDTKIDVSPAMMRAADVAPEEPAPAPTQLLEAPSYEPTPEPEPVKRKGGRPKGSKNKKPKMVASQSYEQEAQPVMKRKRGRPKGSKNKPKAIQS